MCFSRMNTLSVWLSDLDRWNRYMEDSVIYGRVFCMCARKLLNRLLTVSDFREKYSTLGGITAHCDCLWSWCLTDWLSDETQYNFIYLFIYLYHSLNIIGQRRVCFRICLPTYLLTLVIIYWLNWVQDDCVCLKEQLLIDASATADWPETSCFLPVCSFVRLFICLLPNLSLRYFENEWIDFDANWHKWSSGQWRDTVVFGCEKVEVRGHRRQKLDLEAWQRHHWGHRRQKLDLEAWQRRHRWPRSVVTFSRLTTTQTNTRLSVCCISILAAK